MSNINASPAAQELAAKHNVDLATVTGTGADGAITKADVEKAIRAAAEAAAPQAAAPQATAPTTKPAYVIAQGKTVQVVTAEERDGKRHVTGRDVVRPGEEARKNLLGRLTAAQVKNLVDRGVLVPAPAEDEATA